MMPYQVSILEVNNLSFDVTFGTKRAKVKHETYFHDILLIDTKNQIWIVPNRKAMFPRDATANHLFNY